MLVFLHIPKTGGVSVSDAIQRVLPNTMIVRSQPEFETLAKMDPAQLARHDAISGHIPMGVDAYFRKHGVDRDVTYATVVRDPVDRLLSWYWYRVQQPNFEPFKATSGKSFGEWVVSDDYETDNMLVRFFMDRDFPPRNAHWAGGSNIGAEQMESAWANLQRVHILHLYENFDGFVAALSDEVGTKLEVGRTNITANRLGRDDLSPALIKRVEERNRFDYELIKRVKMQKQTGPAVASPGTDEIKAAHELFLAANYIVALKDFAKSARVTERGVCYWNFDYRCDIDIQARTLDFDDDVMPFRVTV